MSTVIKCDRCGKTEWANPNAKEIESIETNAIVNLIGKNFAELCPKCFTGLQDILWEFWLMDGKKKKITSNATMGDVLKEK
jgi:hypothetical protein